MLNYSNAGTNRKSSAASTSCLNLQMSICWALRGSGDNAQAGGRVVAGSRAFICCPEASACRLPAIWSQDSKPCRYPVPGCSDPREGRGSMVTRPWLGLLGVPLVHLLVGVLSLPGVRSPRSCNCSLTLLLRSYPCFCISLSSKRSTCASRCYSGRFQKSGMLQFLNVGLFSYLSATFFSSFLLLSSGNSFASSDEDGPARSRSGLF